MGSEAIWNFVIVGAGPAGCALAVNLARSTTRPQVLLLEAGMRGDDKSLRVDGQRWNTFLNKEVNWGYKTVPQENCNGRQIDYSQDKVLGSTAINFSVFIVRARDDYDEWATVVGDELYKWDRMQPRFRHLETFDTTISDPKNAKYAGPKSSDHGSQGALRVGFASEWEQDLPLMLDVFEQAGLVPHKGRRTTAADLLDTAPENLTVITESPVQRIVLDGKKAIGVKCNGKLYRASKEVILAAGALGSPKILLDSGIGPANQLENLQISVVEHLPSVGQGLKDHLYVPLCFQRKTETNDRNAFFGDNAAMDRAMAQWMKDGTGPWSRYSCQIAAGFFKSDNLLASAELRALPLSVQDFLKRETVPHYELLAHSPNHLVFPGVVKDYIYVCMGVFLMNEQHSGEVRLQSSNPDDPLLFNPKFLSHPFDRRACIEILRDALQVTKHESFQKDTVAPMIVPPSESDDGLFEFWKNTVGSVWHIVGIVRVGRHGDADAAVDSRFRVFGIENLRVADMSVVPGLLSTHLQVPAYMIGMTCAEVLVEEYDLHSAKRQSSRGCIPV
ncbi:glucose-methanol-choline (gmc) oxidoreductase [Aspergillus lentulus]|nr:glucose-methanol-choline (gmc) oxidoreductase [Aspergillus lentulus]GFF82189.1 glucose-methanol-choline (gmc) oxidoreductase [Aspergillus lentulus]GFG05321.1 glucose-methanol-choline (gmc) oxidoreductase [Aspergillus lentulus]